MAGIALVLDLLKRDLRAQIPPPWSSRYTHGLFTAGAAAAAASAAAAYIAAYRPLASRAIFGDGGISVGYCDAGAAATWNVDYIPNLGGVAENKLKDEPVTYQYKEHPVDLKPLFSAFHIRSLALTSVRSFLLFYLPLLEPEPRPPVGDDGDFPQAGPDERHVDLVVPFQNSLKQIVRETSIVTIRRVLERLVVHHCSQRTAWKLLKDVPKSARRKAERDMPAYLFSFRVSLTTFRGHALGVLASWIVQIIIEFYRYCIRKPENDSETLTTVEKFRLFGNKVYSTTIKCTSSLIFASVGAGIGALFHPSIGQWIENRRSCTGDREKMVFVGVGGKKMGLSNPKPVTIELNRLENLLKDKERELRVAQNEIKALKRKEFFKDKAVLEVNKELKKVEEKLEHAKKQMEDKNLEIKKLTDEKKVALSAQFAAEATMRRILASQKEDCQVSAETLTAPLEAEIRMYKNEIAALQEDKRAVNRLMKSKEAALIEAEKKMNISLERALMVENEENKFLQKVNRQKVAEVEKLFQTISELEECILVGGTAANAVRDYQRQVAELNEEKRTIKRELAKAKIQANRVASAVANEGKDEGDEVMHVKQWLEERKFLKGEIQRLKEKLSISERSLRAEAQLKDKLKLRLKTLEEVLSTSSANQVTNSGNNYRFPSPCDVQTISQLRASLAAAKSAIQERPNSTSGRADAAKNLHRSSCPGTNFSLRENVIRKNFWVSNSNRFYQVEKENAADVPLDGQANVAMPQEHDAPGQITNGYEGSESISSGSHQDGCDDLVSGFLYDKLQQEVISLRRLKRKKNEVLSSKEDEIKLLQIKVNALTKAIKVEVKNRRAAVTEKKEMQKLEETKQKNNIKGTEKLS
ncbi:hypothetical protein HPP92_020023 [Vanilla planifolia]|uniref:Uncharacterized protein n=1 Tax=Vanilla planifolia TaxID=51239 RepID=A0A835Q558_VANPL|nr:hypothetical protein HPP92_020023 [Vanilla planifolia]